MATVLFLIFAVEVVAQLINAVGAAQINSLVCTMGKMPPKRDTDTWEQIWTLINYLPVSTSKAAADQRKLQAEYLKVRRDLNATSSQDEFAKWAKLRRQHDKLLEQLEATSMCNIYHQPLVQS